LVARLFRSPIENYARALDIEAGVHRVRFTADGIGHTVTSFLVHGAREALVIDYAADRPGSVSLRATFDSKLKHEVFTRERMLALEVECPGHAHPSYLGMEDPLEYAKEPERRGVRAAALLSCDARGGSVSLDDSGLSISCADRVTLKLCVRTSFAGWDRHPYADGHDYMAMCEEEADALGSTNPDELLKAHVSEFADLMNRAHFSLVGDASDLPTGSDLPTDERLARFDGSDRGLYELLFNYARYLMASSSRPGTQATNLQGIWNESPTPPWSSNYTVNINTEMNYYPAEVANLSAMHEPLFDLVERIVKSGARTARDFYGLRGSVCHHNTDLWARTNPVGEKRVGSAVWAFWPMALPWMCGHLFDHYLYAMDEAFLRERALPAMREAARFLIDFMVPDERGYLRVYPATSPENSFIVNGKTQAVAKAATMSNALARELLTHYVAALDILKLDEPMRAEAQRAIPRIWPYELGSKGQILEWDREYEEAEPHHRHTSHLYGLYPGREIAPDRTPALADACRKTLELRGDDGTGWSLAWKVCFWARLNDGDRALKILKNQLRLVRQDDTVYTSGGGTYPNLFDAHPPFQIDGNFGACAGICEMLIRSRPGEIRLLPALPADWPDGRFTGFRAMGDVEVQAEFRNGKLVSAAFDARCPAALPIKVLYGETAICEIAETGRTNYRSAEE
jgi:alpha-L-fucosidase 2